MAIYTKTGDKGFTSLYGENQRRKKYDQRVIAYAEVDELNSQLGVVLAFLSKPAESIKRDLIGLQRDLFEIASELSTAPGTTPVFFLSKERIKKLEEIIDKLEGSLPVLGNFIFPGGSKPGSLLHVARTVCRRAEREIVELSDKEEVNPNILAYINRLSDVLFMIAREVNRTEGKPEVIWKAK